VKICARLFVLALALLSTRGLFAQEPLDGLWQGYDGEWRHVSQQLIALAQATPADKFAWRPASGVRSTGEIYMHIAMANFWLLSVTGPKMPADMKEGMEKSVTSKADVIAWLSARSEAYAYAFEKPKVIRTAIDHAHVKADAAIAGAREIAFFPPMTGG